MIPSTKIMTPARALTLWASARERARDDLLAQAVRLSRQGLAHEASQRRAAAYLLQVRALQERAQAAAQGSAAVLRSVRL
jgi:hypothetical protein